MEINIPTIIDTEWSKSLAETGKITLPVAYEYWEAIAYDLALGVATEQSICSAYNIQAKQYQDLLANEFFSKLLQAKRDEVSQLTNDASFKVKMRLIASRASSNLLHLMQDPTTNAKDFNALFRTVTELADLVPTPKKDLNQNQLGPAVVFNIQGIPGLEHLGTNLTTTLATPLRVEGEVVDVIPSIPQGELLEL